MLWIKDALGTKASEGKHPHSDPSYMKYFHLPSRWKKDDVKKLQPLCEVRKKQPKCNAERESEKYCEEKVRNIVRRK